MASPVINKHVTLDWSSMSLKDLKAESARLAFVLDLVNRQRGEIFGEIDRRVATAKAVTRVAALTAVEREALKSVLA